MNNNFLSTVKFSGIFKKYQYFFLIVLVGIVFMITPKSVKTETVLPQADEFNLEEFEHKLGNAISKIEGAGRTEIVLTLSSSTEAIYATNTREEESNVSIISTNNYGEEPVLIKKVYPSFRGAAVICDGGENSKVRLKITELLMSVCDITSENISISKMMG